LKHFEDCASEEDCLCCSKNIGVDYCSTCCSRKNPFLLNNANLICKGYDEYCPECQNNIMFLI
jgi:hypothetical protein